MKTILRKIVYYWLLLFSKAISFKISKTLTSNTIAHKGCTTGIIFAPGSTTRQITGIPEHAFSLGINYFIRHGLTCDTYMLEPGVYSESYWSEIENKKNKFTNSMFFIKGYNSPKTIFAMCHELIRASSLGIHLQFFEEVYAWGDSAQNQMLEDKLIIDGPSVSVAINYLIMKGIDTIIFAGFDLGQEYFWPDSVSYPPNKNSLETERGKNLVKSLRKKIMRYTQLGLKFQVVNPSQAFKSNFSDIVAEIELTEFSDDK